MEAASQPLSSAEARLVSKVKAFHTLPKGDCQIIAEIERLGKTVAWKFSEMTACAKQILKEKVLQI